MTIDIDAMYSIDHRRNVQGTDTEENTNLKQITKICSTYIDKLNQSVGHLSVSQGPM